MALFSPPAPPRQNVLRGRLILLGLCALAALLFAWGISRSQYHPFYADAVRSMTLSWKGFVYGSFDPGNTITLDKLPGFLWPQAVSALILGFHPWALTLPQVLEGVLSVAVLHLIVKRWAGLTAGTLAALAFMLTPVVTGLFRTSVEDPAFTLLLLLAAEATQRAARSGRTRTLLLAGVWVGLAFQAKMLEAFAVLPVLAGVYLLSAPASLKRRSAQVGIAGAVTLAVSASWIALVTLTPQADRPYVDGTTDNSPISMVVGYNFLNRFSAVGLNAADTGSVSAVRGGPQGATRPGGHAEPGATTTQPQQHTTATAAAHRDQSENGWGKLLTGELAGEVGWLYPTALAGFAVGVLTRRRRARTDPVRAGYLLWGAWLAVFFVVLSAGSVAGHAYYLGVIAAPAAALTGAGLPLLWRTWRAGGASAFALPVTVAATASWAALLSRPYPTFRPWVTPVALTLGAVSTALLLLPLVVPLFRREEPADGGPVATGRLGRVGTVGLACGLVAVLLTPAVWTASVFDPAYGRSMMGAIGPAAQVGTFGQFQHALEESATAGHGQPSTHEQSGRTDRPGAGVSAQLASAAGHAGTQSAATEEGAALAAAASVWGRMFGFGGAPRLDAGEQAVLAYTTAHRGGARYLFATTSWATASPYILTTGAPVLPVGGFTEQVPWPTVDGIRNDVTTGQLRYVLLADHASSPFGGGGQEFGKPTTAAKVGTWVTANCHPVALAGLQTDRQNPQRLYDCATEGGAARH
ncbi:ArnT family glycosyltransferase [Streptacidiphilus fuscans]|uniref:ArnT family glycosyltransferase n=1 Tax=Streptacidiphilus fuscans TaxID=2789292 RepID=UPI001F2F6865|nr:glycosyltransferase family 39 protein [Streptacidiphilus fuscans]